MTAILTKPDSIKVPSARTAAAPLRLALIGCGAISEQMHLPVLAGHEGIKLAALVDRDEKRARKLADGYGVKSVLRDVDDLSADDFDAAIIATPPFHHAPATISLLQRGLHVIVEKPMALNLAEAEEMCRVADETGRALAVGYFRRFYPSIRLLKGMIDSGQWGRVLSFAAEGGGMYGWAAATLGNMRRDLAGGGVLIDYGSHLLDLLFYLFDEPAEVLDYVDNSLGGIEADCSLKLRLSHDGESIPGTVDLARTRELGNLIRVECERATLEFQFTERFRIRVTPKSADAIDSVGSRRRGCQLEAAWAGEDEATSWYDTFRLQIDDWLDAIATGREPVLSGRSALPTVRVIDACYRQPRPMSEPWVYHGVLKDASQAAELQYRAPQAVNNELPSAPPVTATPRKRVLVTGATGFIGSRVAEIMRLRDGWDVRAIVHNPGNASRLARLPIEMVQGDLKDQEKLRKLVDGCEAVVHCAVGTAWGQRKEIFAVTVDGTRQLAEAALATGAQRMVHLSTISIYGDDKHMTGKLDESTPVRPTKGSEYGESKAAAERAVLAAAKRGLSAVVLRPARVYGPNSRIFINRPVQAIAKGEFRFIGSPDVPADMVYVDNVAEAIIRSLAAPAEAARGEVFTISEGNPITWRAFYEYFAERLGITLDAPIVYRDNVQGEMGPRWWNPLAWLGGTKKVITSKEFKGLGRRVLDTPPLGSLPKWMLETFPSAERMARRMVGADGSLPVYRREKPVPAGWVEMGSGGALVSIDKARRLLGYEPPVSMDQGLDLTWQWLEHAQMVK
jgi:predicted dehydrogenase/nucleoside-diphosphate-sugar epimerase